jgi:hypothetical protein
MMMTVVALTLWRLGGSASGRLCQHERAALDAKAASLDRASRLVGQLDAPSLDHWRLSRRQLGDIAGHLRKRPAI